MKRSILLIFCFILLQTGYSQIIPSDVVEISERRNEFVVSFHLPGFEIKDTVLEGDNNIFTHINIADYFGIIDDIGYPQLPQLTFDLHIKGKPSEFKIELLKADIFHIDLKYSILPTQDDIIQIEDYKPIFEINKDYYETKGELYNFTSQISEPYIVFGENGISFSIFPFTYNPAKNQLEVLKNATFTITYSINEESDKNHYSKVKNSYLSKFFKNYYTGNNFPAGEDFDGRYLMITAPHFESTLTYFANYKRNIGYEVDVVNTNTTGTSASNIKNYIKNRYKNSSTRPDFVLLVGDHEDIPASEGDIKGDYDDPLTDLDYTLLDGNDFFADVFLGRFSVSDNDELKNIINKTVLMEMNMHRFDKKAVLLAGGGNGEDEFVKPHNTIMKDILIPNGFHCDYSYANKGATQTDGLNALNGDYTFFIYRGHGNQSSIGSPFSLSSYYINNSKNTIYPLCFSFACLTNSFGYAQCFGEAWIRSPQGGICFFGATTTTYRHTNNVIEERIFEEMYSQERLSPWINVGMKSYYQRFWSWLSGARRKKHIKSYNLLGDPSYNILGTGCIQDFVFKHNETFESGSQITYRASNSICNENSFEIQNGSTVNLIAGNVIQLKSGFIAQAGSNFTAQIEPCNNGMVHKSVTATDETFEFTPDAENQEIIYPALFSVFPNPTNSDFSISYTINESTPVVLEIYTLSGAKVKTLLSLTEQEAGNYYYNFSLAEYSTGIYLLVLKTNNETRTCKLIKK
jgi:hypothetical protein